MGKQVATVLYVVAMAAVIVSADIVFFKNRFWERLMANVGIVLVFAAFYLRFFKKYKNPLPFHLRAASSNTKR